MSDAVAAPPALASTLAIASLAGAIEVAALSAAGRPVIAALPWVVLGDGLVAILLGLGLRRRPAVAAGATAWVLLTLLGRSGVAQLTAEGSLAGAGLLAVVPVFVAALAGVFGRRPELPQRAVLGGVAFGVTGLVAAMAPHRAPTPADRTSVVVVTVDGLGEVADATFPTAISPTDGDRAGQLAVLTGLHPLRTGVLRDTDPISRAYTTLFEVLADAGYVAAAFTSTADHRAGWSQGFQAFDSPHTGRFEAAVTSLFSGRAARPDAETLTRFAAWWAEHPAGRAVWIQLSDPASVAALPPLDGAIVALVGTHGPRDGGPLSERSVRVGLRLRLPEVPPVNETAVRTLDVAGTVLDAVGLADGFASEGVPLGPYLAGRATRPLSCTLVGRRDGRTWLGLRSDGVKVITDGSTARMYLLEEDPTESSDVSASFPDAVRQAEGALGPELAALARWEGR